jgi:hypothetical protein
MGITGPIRCRVAACPEVLNDGKEWSFYLINDSAVALDWALLHEIQYEWGDIGKSETPPGECPRNRVRTGPHPDDPCPTREW